MTLKKLLPKPVHGQPLSRRGEQQGWEPGDADRERGLVSTPQAEGQTTA